MLNLYDRRFFIFKLLYIQQVLCAPLENNSRLVIDQRQTGKYNIQISLKDIAIIEVDKNEFVDDTINNADEYYYDDDDLTIKPISSWTIASAVKISSTASTSTREPVASNPATNKGVESFKTHPFINTTNILVLNSSLDSSSFFLSSTPSSIATNSDLHLVKEPVLNKKKDVQENVSRLHSAETSRPYMDTLNDASNNNLKEKNSTLFKITSAQPLLLKKEAICKKSYVVDDSGNCRKKRRSSFLKSLFDVLTLLRTKEK